MTSFTRRTLLGTIAATGAMSSWPVAAQTTTIQLWHVFNLETDMIHGAIKRWNEANPTVQIDAKVLPFAQLTNQQIEKLRSIPKQPLAASDRKLDAMREHQLLRLVALGDRSLGAQVVDILHRGNEGADAEQTA